MDAQLVVGLLVAATQEIRDAAVSLAEAASAMRSDVAAGMHVVAVDGSAGVSAHVPLIESATQYRPSCLLPMHSQMGKGVPKWL
mmetsp:Transcript_5006/g.12274  ORF Transcript_5006/g.12274 Transcript_5006/m.12274 type:complete len:84 (-) Transcript_5006:606-857(-)